MHSHAHADSRLNNGTFLIVKVTGKIVELIETLAHLAN